MIEARISEFQPKHVLPVDATADSIRRLAIRQAFCKLEQGDECQAPRSFGRLPACGEQRRKCFVLVDAAEFIVKPQIHIPERKSGLGHAGGLLGHGPDRLRVQGHRGLSSQ